jgi:Synergist-CTERM protein sorting domain-containing protein
MRDIARLVTLALLPALWSPSPALAEMAGAPMDPPSWQFAPGDDPLPLSHEGAFVLQASIRSWDGLYVPTFSITVDDIEGVEVPGETTYLMLGPYGNEVRLLWRGTDPFGAPGDTFTAHVALYNAEESWEDDIIVDVSLTMIDEATPTAEAPVLVSHLPTDMFAPYLYTCVLPRAEVLWVEPTSLGDWMAPFTLYRSETLDQGGGVEESYTFDTPGTVAHTPTLLSLGETYCLRLVTMNLADGTEAALESCLDNQTFVDALAEGQTLCTVDNLDDHEDIDEDEGAPPSSGGCHTTGTSTPWLLALLALLILTRRRKTLGQL